MFDPWPDPFVKAFDRTHGVKASESTHDSPLILINYSIQYCYRVDALTEVLCSKFISNTIRMLLHRTLAWSAYFIIGFVD